MNGNGEQPIQFPVPLLGQKSVEKAIVVVEVDGVETPLVCECSGFAVDQNGNLHVMVQGQPHATFAAGVWKSIRRGDYSFQVMEV